MRSYRITWWHEDSKGRRKEKSREIIEADNAEKALRQWFGKAGDAVSVTYDQVKDEAVSYGMPANKSFGWTAEKVK